MPKNIEVDNFKKLLLDMHRGYPRWVYDAKDVSKYIPSPQIEDLSEKGYLTRLISEDGKHKGYVLGPNSLTLISSWKNEELSIILKNLTIVIVALTFFLAMLTLYLIFTPK